MTVWTACASSSSLTSHIWSLLFILRLLSVPIQFHSFWVLGEPDCAVGPRQLLYLFTDKTNWIWGRIDLVGSTRHLLAGESKSILRRAFLTSQDLQFLQLHSFILQWMDEYFIWSQLAQHEWSWRSLWLIPSTEPRRLETTAKSLRVTCFNSTKKTALSFCWYCTALMQHMHRLHNAS